MSRRAWAASIATAQLAIRDRTLSARLVRMIGTRAPSTRPALSALARKRQLLGQNVAGFEVRHQQDVRIAGDLGQDPLGLGRLLADRVVEGQRTVEHAAGDLAAIGHLAQRTRRRSSPASSS